MRIRADWPGLGRIWLGLACVSSTRSRLGAAYLGPPVVRVAKPSGWSKERNRKERKEKEKKKEKNERIRGGEEKRKRERKKRFGGVRVFEFQNPNL